MNITATTWYHGTAEDFDAFDPEYLETGAGGAGTDAGFWFTDNYEAASLYARYTGGDRVLAVALDLRAPHVVDVAEEVRAEIEKLVEMGVEIESDDYADLYQIVFPDMHALGGLIRDAVAEARAKGADGVIFENIVDNPCAGDEMTTRWANKPQTHALVFNPAAITIMQGA